MISKKAQSVSCRSKLLLRGMGTVLSLAVFLSLESNPLADVWPEDVCISSKRHFEKVDLEDLTHLSNKDRDAVLAVRNLEPYKDGSIFFVPLGRQGPYYNNVKIFAPKQECTEGCIGHVVLYDKKGKLSLLSYFYVTHLVLVGHLVIKSDSNDASSYDAQYEDTRSEAIAIASDDRNSIIYVSLEDDPRVIREHTDHTTVVTGPWGAKDYMKCLLQEEGNPNMILR